MELKYERAQNLIKERARLAKKIHGSGFTVFRILYSRTDSDDAIFLLAKSWLERLSAIEREVGQILKIEMNTYPLRGDFLTFIRCDNAFLLKKIKQLMKLKTSAANSAPRRKNGKHK